MRRFSSYGPIQPTLHYHAHRQELIDSAYTRLTGETSSESGHYITVWAPRQTGKTWVMQETVRKIKKEDRFEAGIITIEAAKDVLDETEVVKIFTRKLSAIFQREFPHIEKIRDIESLFTKKYFQKPVILIIDEFDSLVEEFINRFASIFRDINIGRSNEEGRQSYDKTNILHGLALIGVRSVLGIENVKGSPFNVQRSLHAPNLTYDEVNGIFKWYEKDSGQHVEQEVIDRVFYETNGQPGLTCWLGELLTETYNEDKTAPITMKRFNYVYISATQTLPNNNILNIISKAKQEPHKAVVLELFKTDRKMEFRFDDESLNYLYMNGIIDIDRTETGAFCKFSNPFVQSRLFNHFTRELFSYMGALVEPFINLDHVITDAHLNIANVVAMYQEYLGKNKEWLFKNAPRRSDLRIYEAVYHFNLYAYLYEFLRDKGGTVVPEFPTGNGIIDLIVKYAGQTYGLELKSYTDNPTYEASFKKSALYGKQLGLENIFLLFFVSAIDEGNRKKLEVPIKDEETGVTVIPIFIATGN